MNKYSETAARYRLSKLDKAYFIVYSIIATYGIYVAVTMKIVELIFFIVIVTCLNVMLYTLLLSISETEEILYEILEKKK